MLNLFKRAGSPHWQICGTLRGIRVRESTGTTSKPHAEAIRAQREKEILDRSVYGEAVTATFAEAVNLYLDLGGSPRYLEPLVERWGAWRLQRITQLEVTRAAHELYPDAAASTKRRQLYTPINAVLNRAAKSQLCAPPKLTAPRVVHTVVEAPDDAWIATVLTAPARRALAEGSKGAARFQAARQRLTGVVMMMTLTGARVSEAAALRWRDVDLERGVALLPHTKSGQPRACVLPPDLIAAIGDLTRSSKRAPDDAVFGYASRYSVRQALQRTADAAGVERFSCHQVGRHAFAKRMLADGATLADVAKAGGWADIAIVARYYGHLERKSVDRAVVEAGKKLTQAMQSPTTNVLQYRSKAQ